jgi:hypothetical protein
MKNILTIIPMSICLLSFLLTPIYSQNENNDTVTTQQESLEIGELNENNQDSDDKESLKETLNEEAINQTSFSFTFWRILVGLIAPSTFLLILYLLIKKLKL